MKRVARKDALFCLMVPNSNTFYWKCWQRLSKESQGSNENAFTLKEWHSLFEKHGLEVQQLSRDDWRLRKFLGSLGIKSGTFLYNFIRQIICSVIPISRAHQFILF